MELTVDIRLPQLRTTGDKDEFRVWEQDFDLLEERLESYSASIAAALQAVRLRRDYFERNLRRGRQAPMGAVGAGTYGNPFPAVRSGSDSFGSTE